MAHGEVMETQVAEQVSHWGGIHLNDKNPGGDYSGFSSRGWRASTINEMERIQISRAAPGYAWELCTVDSGEQKDSRWFVSWKFLTGSYDELLTLNRLQAAERFGCACRGWHYRASS